MEHDIWFWLHIGVFSAALLGLVGAGGIGMVLNSAIDVFEWDRVALVLVVGGPPIY